jgi:hypothetical protein
LHSWVHPVEFRSCSIFAWEKTLQQQFTVVLKFVPRGWFPTKRAQRKHQPIHDLGKRKSNLIKSLQFSIKMGIWHYRYCVFMCISH